MAKVILDVPSEKMSLFVKAMLSLGLQEHNISTTTAEEPNFTDKIKGRFKNFTRKYLGWEMNRTELEFE